MDDKQIINLFFQRDEDAINAVDENKRIIFLRRYWYSDSIKDISERMQMSESAVKVTLHRTRKELRKYLESEGLYL